MILYINSTDFNKVTFALKGARVIVKTYQIDPHESHKMLTQLEVFLKGVRCKMSEITRIVINKGPGSYTGVRVGLAHSMALSLALDIPVKALSNEQFLKTIA